MNAAVTHRPHVFHASLLISILLLSSHIAACKTGFRLYSVGNCQSALSLAVQANAIRLPLHLNLAACDLQSKEWHAAVANCDEVSSWASATLHDSTLSQRCQASCMHDVYICTQRHGRVQGSCTCRC